MNRFEILNNQGGTFMLEQLLLNFLKQLAKGIAGQFGPDCEVVIHDLSDDYTDNSIVAIENGQVTSRKIGDAPSQAVLDALHSNQDEISDRIGYLIKTQDGRILKATTLYIRNNENKIIGLFAINFDITKLTLLETAINPLISAISAANGTEPKRFSNNVTDLLDDLLKESVRRIGKPVALMNREDKIAAINFLNDRGALLITKSGDLISNYFGISKYTLYSYIDTNNNQAK